MAKKVIVIGSGFAGLSAASFMARAGWEVHVLEKHDIPGGRARQLQIKGFIFDMGPSWYWMPGVFERYFGLFGKQVQDYYELKRLDPSYRIYFPDTFYDIPAGPDNLSQLFESLEPGAAQKLRAFLQEAHFKYMVGMQKLVFKPGQSITEFLDIDVIKGVSRLDVFTSMHKHIRKYFKHPVIHHLLEFPILFLGALPSNTPALYSLMNYADIVGGTWYPIGGMYKVVEAMYTLALELGVQFHFGEEATKIHLEGNNVKSVSTVGHEWKADAVIGAADYHFIETSLLPPRARSYSEEYWNTRVMAPSCLLYYVGLNKTLNNIRHHSLFFDTDFQQHAKEIYITQEWPSNPLFYVSATSVTDASVAPEGCENLFFLVPLAAGLQDDTEAIRERYFNNILHRFEQHIEQKISDAIVFKQSFALSDFVHEYNSFKGNAYGLANTLKQTAILKPSCRSKKVKNLFYTGQLTVPGPGVPPSLISGEVVANELLKHFGK